MKFLGRVFQLQARGVYHVHAVIGYETEAQKIAARLYVQALRDLAREHDFGFVDARNQGDGSTVMGSERAAGYLSRYLADSSESSQFVQAVKVGLVRRPVYVARELTTQSGCTMRNLRRVRYLWWIRQGRSVIAEAGKLPKWFSIPAEYAAVARLASVP